jgi:hypothetical protein
MMPATTSRRVLHLTATVALVLLAGGCAGHKAPSTAASGRGTATSPAAPTATPMTAAELSWVTAITNLHKKLDKPFRASSMTMTRAKMTELGNTLRACRRELRRIGFPGNRLRPAYVMAEKACRTYSKGARCFAKAASASDAVGGTVVGTPPGPDAAPVAVLRLRSPGERQQPPRRCPDTSGGDQSSESMTALTAENSSR